MSELQASGKYSVTDKTVDVPTDCKYEDLILSEKPCNLLDAFSLYDKAETDFNQSISYGEYRNRQLERIHVGANMDYLIANGVMNL